MVRFPLSRRELRLSGGNPRKAGEHGPYRHVLGREYAKTRAEKRLQLPVPPGNPEIRTGATIVNE
jgi:hypothetical protein